MNRKECEEALNHIIYCDRDDMGMSYLSDAYRNDISTLSKLIYEHFDNQPLKYEELEKALDKACEELESLDYKLKMKEALPCSFDCDYVHAEEWKKELLK